MSTTSSSAEVDAAAMDRAPPPAEASEETSRKVNSARVRQVFTELLKSGVDANDAAAEALSRATDEMLTELQKSGHYQSAPSPSHPSPAASFRPPAASQSPEPVVAELEDVRYSFKPTSSLTALREARLRALFAAFDLNGDGTVGLDEFLSIGQAIYGTENWTESANTAAFGRVDTDGSGTIDADEFVSIFERSIQDVDDLRFEELMERYNGAAASCASRAAAIQVVEQELSAAQQAQVNTATVAAAMSAVVEPEVVGTVSAGLSLSRAAATAKPESGSLSVVQSQGLSYNELLEIKPQTAEYAIKSRFTKFNDGLTPFWVSAVRHLKGERMAQFIINPN